MQAYSEANVYQTLVNTAKQLANHIAVFDEAGAITFAELLKQTEELKSNLESFGIVKGSSLAIINRNSRHFIISLYAGIGCGCVVMPLAPYQQIEEIEKAIREANIHFVLSEKEISIKSQEHHTFNSHNKTFHFHRTENLLTEIVSKYFINPAVMRFTSGTTADAKCVVLSHQTILERTQAANEGLKLTEQDRVVWVLPMVYHFVVSIMLYVRYGAGIIICNDFLAENILSKAQQCEGTVLYASPMHIRLLATAHTNNLFSKLRLAISTTAGISLSICGSFQKKFGIAVSQAFGIIEVGLPIINSNPTQSNQAAVGRALPSFEIAVLDETCNALPSNTLGQLAIKGPGMFDGYLKPLKKKGEILKNGWFLTGDLATIDESGVIEIKGRSKNVINVSGNKVFPDEVEEVLNQHPNIKQSKVKGRPHPLLGEMVIADVELQSATDFDEEGIISFCRQHLSSFKIPQRIFVVDRIEMTGSGKVKRA